MLVLTRKAKQSIMIGDDVELLAAVDHGREGPPRDPGPAGDPGVPQGDLLGDPATEPRGRYVGAPRGGRRARAVERTQQPLLSKPPAGFTTEEQPFSSVRRHGPAGSLVSIAATSTNAGYGALVRSCHRPTTPAPPGNRLTPRQLRSRRTLSIHGRPTPASLAISRFESPASSAEGSNSAIAAWASASALSAARSRSPRARSSVLNRSRSAATLGASLCALRRGNIVTTRSAPGDAATPPGPAHEV